MIRIPLVRESLNGHAAYKSNSDTAYCDNTFLVKTNETTGEWEAVDKVDRNLNNSDLTHSYGMWKDSERIADGPKFLPTFARHHYQPDGKIQADEVKTFAAMETESYRTTSWPSSDLKITTDYKVKEANVEAPTPSAATLQLDWQVVGSWRQLYGCDGGC